MANAGHTYTEILMQVDAWQNADAVLTERQSDVKKMWDDGGFTHVIFTGCGSTHYLSMTAASLFQSETGVMSRAAPASEILFHPEQVFSKNQKTLLVTISRSATTTETVMAAERFRENYGENILVISCYDDKPLNQFANFTLAAPAGQELSVAQTRSFSAMTILAEGFAKIVAGTYQPDLFSHDHGSHIATTLAFIEERGLSEDFEQYFYLGSGARYGLALEAMLKMKEMSLTYAEAYHPMEFRHGPMSMVDERTLVVGLLAEEAYSAEKAVLDHMRKLGATTVEFSPLDSSDFKLKRSKKPYSMVHYLPVLQWLAYYRAIEKGLDPDNPRNLSQVIELEDL